MANMILGHFVSSVKMHVTFSASAEQKNDIRLCVKTAWDLEGRLMPKARILIVEDEGIIAQDIRASLQELGYEVCATVATGEDAVRKAETERPDLALVDVVLQGGMDGIEAAHFIHSRFRVPIVYLTAYADDKMLERAKMTEPFGYLIKPFREQRTALHHRDGSI